MRFIDLISQKGYTLYSLSKKSNVAKSTLSDIANGKSNILECRGRVLLNISKALDITIEELINLEYEEYNSYYEENVPPFLKRDLEMLRKIKGKKCSVRDCYLDETNSSINVCEVENIITKEHANYLRRKYLW
ncbi:MAG: helix-turn-helix transcriptional regulator [Bacilli bacterium]|nr:helix-turn-helix transcriptional regulator [Bacilli bacterium]